MFLAVKAVLSARASVVTAGVVLRGERGGKDENLSLDSLSSYI
jgi:hypothetical protein